jgi:hypothetical protein
MASAALFVRIPPELRLAVDAHVAERGMSLSSAVADLLSRGLAATADEDSLRALELSLRDARTTVASRDQQLREAAATVAAAEAREKSLRDVAHQLEAAPIGQCRTPGCGAPFNPVDLVVRRRCPKGHPLTPVLEGAAKAPGLNSTDALIALAAIGLLVGLVAAAAKA